MKDKKIQRILFALVLSLTLGLAPFSPEPHVVQKWRWLLDGADGMGGMDWFDLIMHSAPFMFLAYTVVDFLRQSGDDTGVEKKQNLN